MGDTTDQLLSLARRVHPDPPVREQDMLVSVGERISVALLAMALHLKGGMRSVSRGASRDHHVFKAFEARILDVKPHRILRALDSGKIAIVAGFQGSARRGRSRRWTGRF